MVVMLFLIAENAYHVFTTPMLCYLYLNLYYIFKSPNVVDLIFRNLYYTYSQFSKTPAIEHGQYMAWQSDRSDVGKDGPGRGSS